jgi:predicted ester cyclase
VSQDVRELLGRVFDDAEYHRVLQLWKTHSIAEDQRNLEGLISTLTPDCVYEVVQFGKSWKGHDGARRFYTELLTAFPDIRFALQDIVVGPQGVAEDAVVTGTFQRDWLDYRASGGPVTFRVVIFFPWDRPRGKFTGERIYVDAAALTRS